MLTEHSWLSRAELSTCSSSPRILPRLIYLSHQFSFHALGEDYHALLRGAHLDVPASKIEVHKPIEVPAFSMGGGDTFVQSIPSHHHHHDIGRASSSFDEPLASALAAPVHPLNPSPPVLPMLSNGTPGSASKSLMHAIPIRQVAAGIQDGMTEGLGRMRRELGKARSPRLVPVRWDDSVPLEFGEEDEDFVVKDSARAPEEGVVGVEVMSRSTSMATAATSTSATEDLDGDVAGSNMVPLPIDQDDGQVWQGWDPEDQQAVEDAERFDDITVGFMDEEHETMRDTAVKKSLERSGGEGR